MTLDEAIKHCEEVANKCDTECAKEHRQLAEWLKDYKRLLEQQPQEDIHREREQAYMQGYEDASKKYRQPQDGDVIWWGNNFNTITIKSASQPQEPVGKTDKLPTHYGNDDLIHRETARRIISSPRTQEQMLMVLDTALPVDAIPTSKVRDAIDEISEYIGYIKTDDVIKIIGKHTKVGDADAT